MLKALKRRSLTLNIDRMPSFFFPLATKRLPQTSSVAGVPSRGPKQPKPHYS